MGGRGFPAAVFLHYRPGAKETGTPNIIRTELAGNEMLTENRKAKKNTRVYGALFSALGGMCWGLSGSMGQYLFRYQGMDSRWLVPYRLGIAGIIMFVFCFLRFGGKKLFSVFESPRAAFYTIYYAMGISVCQFLYFQTIQWSTAGIGTILQDLSPVFVLAWACITMKRWPEAREILAIILALAGVFLITTHGQIQSAHVPLRALLAGVGSAVCVTLYNEVPKDILDRYSVIILQTWGFLIGGGMLFFIFHPWTAGYTPTAAGYGGIAFVVVVGNVMAFTFYMTGVKLIGPGKAVLYGFAEPVTAAIITFVLFRSPFTIFDAAGFAAVFAMLVLISLPGRKDGKGKEDT